MIPTLSLLFVLAAPVLGHEPALVRPTVCAAPAEEKAVKALEAWLKLYRSGKLDVSSQEDSTRDSIAQKFGILQKGLVGKITALRDLELILEQVIKLDTPSAAEGALEVAAIGLDQSKVVYTTQMLPFAVRATGEKWLAKCTGPIATDYLGKVARGEVKFDKANAASMRAASLRMQGARKEGADRALLEKNLGAPEVPVRLACAEALQQLADEAAVPAMAMVLEQETSDAVATAIAQAMHACYRKYLDASKPAAKKDGDAKPEEGKAQDAPQLPESTRIAARSVVKALGKTTWRADMALVQFLYDFRTKDAVPGLIDLLQRFKDHPEDVQSGKLSGLLQHRVHETLVSMTGAMLPIDAPDKWRELWEKDKDTIAVVPRQAVKSDGKNATVAGNFCGIPVQGSRVLFIVDLSGSMGFPMKSAEPDGNRPGTRLDFAKKQLHKVIGDLPETSKFNFITYNGNPKPEVWNKDLLLANSQNKNRAFDFVDKMRADGGTNMWSGLEEGLKMKSLVYGERYASNVDEIFLVSDGAPSVGEIIDPAEILQLVTETNKFSKVRLNTIFITSVSDQDPRNLSLTPSELMRKMAGQNGGKFVEFKD